MKRPLTTTVIAAAIAAASPGSADAVRIDYSLDAGYERDDNVALSSTDPIEQDILRLGRPASPAASTTVGTKTSTTTSPTACWKDA